MPAHAAAPTDSADAKADTSPASTLLLSNASSRSSNAAERRSLGAESWASFAAASPAASAAPAQGGTEARPSALVQGARSWEELPRVLRARADFLHASPQNSYLSSPTAEGGAFATLRAARSSPDLAGLCRPRGCALSAPPPPRSCALLGTAPTVSAAGPAPSLANAWPRCFCGTFGRALLLLLVAAAKAA